MDRAPGSDARAELAGLAAAVRAYAEWQADTGALGLPVEAGAGTLLASLSGGGSPARTASRVMAPQARTSPIPVAPSQSNGRPAVVSVDIPRRPMPVLLQAAPGDDPGAASVAVKAVADLRASSLPAIAPASAAIGTGDGADERPIRLALLAEEVRSCTACPLHLGRQLTVFARGNPFAELCFVGEGPGADEDVRGEPFVGAAGQLLDRMILAMGYARDDVYVCNIVKCRPPNNRKPDPMEVATCGRFLAQQLSLVKPRALVALGATAVQGLLGATEGITRMRGKWKLYKGLIPVMPTFHPAYLLRTPSAKREVWADLQEVMKHLGKTPDTKA